MGVGLARVIGCVVVKGCWMGCGQGLVGGRVVCCVAGKGFGMGIGLGVEVVKIVEGLV